MDLLKTFKRTKELTGTNNRNLSVIDEDDYHHNHHQSLESKIMSASGGAGFHAASAVTLPRLLKKKTSQQLEQEQAKQKLKLGQTVQYDEKRRKKLSKRCKENILIFFTVMGVVVGIVLGFLLRIYVPNLSPTSKLYVGFLGELFLRMLKFMIVPLVTSSLINGIASLGGTRNTGRVALRAFAYYLTTTFLAVLLGLFLVILIQPGTRVKLGKLLDTANPLEGKKISCIDTILDLIRNLFPDNIVQMAFMQYESRMVLKQRPQTSRFNETSWFNLSNSSLNYSSGNYQLIANHTINIELNEKNSRDLEYWYPMPAERYGINVLGLVMFSIVLGYLLPKMKRNGKILLDVSEAIHDASVKIIELIMIFSPIGICSLICFAVLSMENPKLVMEKISFYMMTVVAGLLVHGLIVLPLLFVIITKKNVFVYAKNMIEAFLVAFATSSSNATLPVTLKCIEENNKVPKSISRFVIPVGATINMDGTALYEAVAAVFIAQINNIDLKLVDYVVTSLTATLASIGAAGVPSAGLMTMVIVLSALNLPQAQISLIYTVDWFLTIINIWGDTVGAAIVAHLSQNELASAGAGADSSSTTSSGSAYNNINVEDEQEAELAQNVRLDKIDEEHEQAIKNHTNDEADDEDDDDDDDNDNDQEDTHKDEEDEYNLLNEKTNQTNESPTSHGDKKQPNLAADSNNVETDLNENDPDDSFQNENFFKPIQIHTLPASTPGTAKLIRINEGFLPDEEFKNETTF